MSTKAWINGATGLLGRAILREFKENHEGKVIGTGFSRAVGDIQKLDLLNEGAVEDFMEKEQPRFVIHSAAERRPDISENDPDATWAMNVEVTQRLAGMCNESGAWMLYISTDYVFDGTTPPYQPGDTPNPLNHYGRSKLAGEQAIQETGDDFGILRVPILYGQIENLEESAVTTMVPFLLQDVIPPQDHWATRYPTHVDDVALVCRQMVGHKAVEEGFHGIYHWSANEPYTKYEMALTMAPSLGVDPELIKADSNPSKGTPRPEDCALESTALESLALGRQRSFAEAIASVIEEALGKEESPG